MPAPCHAAMLQQLWSPPQEDQSTRVRVRHPSHCYEDHEADHVSLAGRNRPCGWRSLPASLFQLAISNFVGLTMLSTCLAHHHSVQEGGRDVVVPHDEVEFAHLPVPQAAIRNVGLHSQQA